MSIPYELTITDGGYEFTSDLEIHYYLYFTNYYLSDEDGNDLVIPMFGFDCSPERGQLKKDQKKKHDPRVRATIISLIEEFFERDPQNGLLYICGQKEDMAENRSIVFSLWHKELADKIEKHDNEQTHEKLKFYTSLLVVKNNPNKNKYIDAFYRHLDEMLA